MTHHKDSKGIVHTTSYEQLNFIKENISEERIGGAGIFSKLVPAINNYIFGV
jgi:Rad3-related DNA helicase